MANKPVHTETRDTSTRDNRQLSFAERIFLPDILRGLRITLRHFFANIFLWGQRQVVTISYPETKRPVSPRWRGRHRLTVREDGTPRCTACFLCATACPAKCINIEAGEHPDSEVEKFPVRYEIDTLQCIYCGMCIEACPCDAIRMDTYVHPRVWGYRREDFIEPKAVLMQRSRVLQERGRDALMEDQLRFYEEAQVPPAGNERPALPEQT